MDQTPLLFQAQQHVRDFYNKTDASYRQKQQDKTPWDNTIFEPLMKLIGATSYDYEKIITGTTPYTLDTSHTRFIGSMIVSLFAERYANSFFSLEVLVSPHHIWDKTYVNKILDSEFYIQGFPNDTVKWVDPSITKLLKNRYDEYIAKSKLPDNANLIAGCQIVLRRVDEKFRSLDKNIVHANALIVNALEEVIYIFEPHGGKVHSREYQTNLSQLIIRALETSFRVIFLLDDLIGPQTLQSAASAMYQKQKFKQLRDNGSVAAQIEGGMKNKKNPYLIWKEKNYTENVSLFNQYRKACIVSRNKAYVSKRGVCYSTYFNEIIGMQGFCCFWSLMIMHLTIMYNRKKSLPEILNEIVNLSPDELLVVIRLYTVWCAHFFIAYRRTNVFSLNYIPGAQNNSGHRFDAFLAQYNHGKYNIVALRFCNSNMDGIVSVVQNINRKEKTVACQIYMSESTFNHLNEMLSSNAKFSDEKKISYLWNSVDVVSKEIFTIGKQDSELFLGLSFYPFYSSETTLFQVQSSNCVKVIGLPKNIDQIRKYPLFLIPEFYRNNFEIGTCLSLEEFVKFKQQIKSEDYFPRGSPQNVSCTKNLQQLKFEQQQNSEILGLHPKSLEELIKITTKKYPNLRFPLSEFDKDAVSSVVYFYKSQLSAYRHMLKKSAHRNRIQLRDTFYDYVDILLKYFLHGDKNLTIGEFLTSEHGFTLKMYKDIIDKSGFGKYLKTYFSVSKIAEFYYSSPEEGIPLVKIILLYLFFLNANRQQPKRQKQKQQQQKRKALLYQNSMKELVEMTKIEYPQLRFSVSINDTDAIESANSFFISQQNVYTTMLKQDPHQKLQLAKKFQDYVELLLQLFFHGNSNLKLSELLKNEYNFTRPAIIQICKHGIGKLLKFLFTIHELIKIYGKRPNKGIPIVKLILLYLNFLSARRSLKQQQSNRQQSKGQKQKQQTNRQQLKRQSQKQQQRSPSNRQQSKRQRQQQKPSQSTRSLNASLM